MMTKIIFTAAVIALVYLVAQQRSRGGGNPRRPPSASGQKKPADRLPRYFAYALLAVMLAGSGLFIFLEWRDNYRIVDVKVINTNTGSSVTYQARRGNVVGRGFETIDGRKVTLADVERMEMGVP